MKKRFGQHFLKDPAHAGKIAEAIEGWGTTYEHLVEIGPGGGVLTNFLAEKATLGRTLKLIEIDRDLIEPLRAKYESQQVSIENIDFLDADLEQIGNSFGVCGNFPYNISSQIVFRVLEQRARVPEVVGMFQKEVAQRIAAAHGSKTYGILSVLVQSYYEVKPVFTLKPGAFNPPPKVDSMVIRMERFRSEIEGLDETHFFRLVKAAFNQRRKTLRNSLAAFLNEKNNLAAINGFLHLRPEQMSVTDFINLSREIQKHVN